MRSRSRRPPPSPSSSSPLSSSSLSPPFIDRRSSSWPSPTRQFQLVPLVVSCSEPTHKAQLRSLSARLVGRLCESLPSDCIRRELVPTVQQLCQDPSTVVRAEIAQRLVVIARSLNNAADCATLILPCLIELCKDEAIAVREAVLNTIGLCLAYLPVDSQRNAVVPLLRRTIEKALLLRDTTLGVVAGRLGSWFAALREVLSAQDERWFLDTFCRLAENTSDRSCRRQCAYNFPCFVQFASRADFAARLLPLLGRLAAANSNDDDDEVRATIAAGFHEVVRLRPDEPTLLPFFIELVRGGVAEVVQLLAAHFDTTLPALYAALADDNVDSSSSSTSSSSPKVSREQLDRLLLGCNRLIRSSGSWRSHEAYLLNLAVLRDLVPPHDLVVSFVPLVKDEILKARALPCRAAAVRTLLLLMRSLPLDRDRADIIAFFTKTVAQHESCQRRRLYADAVIVVLEHFSRRFFIEHFFDRLLELVRDAVSNIRLQMTRLLCTVKSRLVYPTDETTIARMEKTVRELLADATGHDLQLLQQYAVELARCETSGDEDAVRIDDERRLWTNVDSAATATAKTITKPTTTSSGGGGRVKPPPPPVPAKPKRRGSTDGIAAPPRIAPLSVSASTSAIGNSTTTSPSTPPSASTSPSSPTVAVASSSSTLAPSTTTAAATTTATLDPWTARPKAIVRPQPQVTITQRAPSPRPLAVATDLKASKLPRYRQSAVGAPSAHELAKYRTDARRPPLVGLRRSTTASDALASVQPPLSVVAAAAASRANADMPTKPSALVHSRSASNVRRPYSLFRVQSSSSVVDRKPPSLSLRVTSMS